jgi:hypothetical protein
MSESNNVWMWASVALLCTTILAGYMALNNQSKLSGLQADYDALLERAESTQGSLADLTILVDIRIDYGGDNVVWYNSTRVPLNAKLLEATEIIASVDSTVSEYGAIVNGIDDVGGDEGFFWLWYTFEDGGWQLEMVGADTWSLKDGDIVAWEYTDVFPF